MKKLRLKLDGIKGMLTRDEMKKVVGGYEEYSSCSITVSCLGEVDHVSCSASGSNAACGGSNNAGVSCSSDVDDIREDCPV